jgi:class 3 adenylate cyclase
MTARLDDAEADLRRTIAELEEKLRERTAERDEAVDQQIAISEVLQVINAAPGDLAPVFDAMLEKAIRLCEATIGVLWVRDAEGFRAAALRGIPPAFEERVRASVKPHLETGLGRILSGESLVINFELATDIGPTGVAPERALAGLEEGCWSIEIALRKNEMLFGALTVYRREVRPFSDKQVALVKNFAAQAVIAIDNARLITETREALEQQTATAEVLGVINSSPGDLAPVFDAMLAKVLRLCDAAFASLVTFDGALFHNVAHRGVPAELIDSLRQPLPPTPGASFARLVEGDAIVHIADIADTDAYRAGIRGRVAMVERGGARTAVWVALRKEVALLGAFVIYRQEVRPFTDKQIALLENFAAQAVIAMENARLLGELRERTDEIAGWNKELEARVATQLAELERTGKLRRFLAPQLAELIVAQGDESILESHRREIVVVFCDLRGFTGFAERAEPEEVMALLREYHAAMGPIVAQYEGTIDHYGGDGIMVFFNDPVPTPDPANRAIDMAVAMREQAQPLLRLWRRQGHDLGFGVGIAQGYATLGQIGFAERMDYTAIGTVTNLAARLCAEAKDGQILLSARVAMAVEESAKLEEIGDLALKGLSQAVAVYNVVL